MLTADLVRYRISGDRVSPRYITKRQAEHYLSLCGTLMDVFQNHTGKTRFELNAALETVEGERTDFKTFRGLTKLLEERCEFTPAMDIDYPGLRHHIFSAAQSHYPIVSRSDLLHRNEWSEILESVASHFGQSADDIEQQLYGDLEENRILQSFDDDITAECLLRRYNLALAQGLLYRAARMRILLYGDYRIVFQYIKLAHLMHWIKPCNQGLEILLDGPASLFHHTQRYGVRMSKFLPGLLLANEWTMEAEIQTYQGRKQFTLDHHCGLHSHYTKRPPFDSRLEEQFFTKFSRKDRGWTIERENEVIDLGDAIFIPDFTFQHPDGRRAHLEIIGFWTPEYLQKKIEKINKADRRNLFLAVNKQLRCSREDFKGEVIYFRTGIKLGQILEKLEQVAE